MLFNELFNYDIHHNLQFTISIRNMDQLSKCGKELAAVYADILRIDHKLKLILEHGQYNQTLLNTKHSIEAHISLKG